MPKSSKTSSAVAASEAAAAPVVAESKTAVAPAVAKSAKVAKTTQKKESKEAATAPVVAPEVKESAPVAAKVAKAVKTSQKKESKEVAAPAPAPVDAPVAPAAAPATTESCECTTTQTVSINVNTIVTKVKAFMMLGAEILRDVRALEKSHSRELKAAQKAGQKKKRKNSNHSPSGFIKQAPISNEMADFLGKSHGTQMSRTEVTNEINAYIKKHDLQNKDKSIGGGRIILADEKLQSLLQIPQQIIDAKAFNYFKLQHYLKIHFPKPVAAAVVAATA